MKAPNSKYETSYLTTLAVAQAKYNVYNSVRSPGIQPVPNGDPAGLHTKHGGTPKLVLLSV